MTEIPAEPDTIVEIERVGGFAGFGLPGSGLRSVATCAWSELSEADRDAIAGGATAAGGVFDLDEARDGFYYRVTVHAPTGPITYFLREGALSETVVDSLVDQFV